MFVEVHVPINGSRAAPWSAMTNIEYAAQILSGVDKIEIPMTLFFKGVVRKALPHDLHDVTAAVERGQGQP